MDLFDQNNIANSKYIFFKEFLFITILPLFLKELGILLCFIFFINKIILNKKEWYFKSLFYFFIYRYFNPVIFPDSLIIIILSFTLLLLVFFKVFFYSGDYNLKEVKILTLFILFTLLASLFKSDYFSISIFKLLSFWIGIITVYKSLKMTRYFNWERFLISFWIFLLILGFFTLPFPEISFARNSTGFQGVTSHPQFYGPFCAIIGGSFLPFLYTNRKKLFFSKNFVNIILVLNFITVFLSESRTAMVTLVILSFISISILVKNLKLKLFKISKLIITTLIASFIILINYSSIEKKVVNFLAKDRNQSTTNINFNKFSETRSELFKSSMEAFMNNPFLGIGFGTPNGVYEFEIQYLPYTNIPISASVEKGVLFSSILEETGIIGFVIFCVFYLSIMIKVWRLNKLYFPMVLAVIIVNFGEATFFSTNGQGIFLYFLLFLPLITVVEYNRKKTLF